MSMDFMALARNCRTYTIIISKHKLKFCIKGDVGYLSCSPRYLAVDVKSQNANIIKKIQQEVGAMLEISINGKDNLHPLYVGEKTYMTLLNNSGVKFEVDMINALQINSTHFTGRLGSF